MDQEHSLPASVEEAANPEQVHLFDYLRVIKRRKRVVGVVFLFVVIVGTVISYSRIPSYKATAQIIIEKQSPQTFKEKVLPMNVNESEYYRTQYNLLVSRSLVYKVIKDLELREYLASRIKPENQFSINAVRNKVKDLFAPILNNAKSFIKGFFSSSISDPSVNLSRPLGRQSEHVLKSEDLLVNWYLSHLGITPVPESRLIKISFRETSPELTALVANGHARAFIDKNFKDQIATSQRTFDWFKTQLHELGAKVESSKREAAEFKNKQQLITAEGRQGIVSKELFEVHSALTKAKMARIESEITYKQLEEFSIDNETLFSLPEVMKDKVIQDLRRQWLKLKRERERLIAEYEVVHPDLTDIDIQLDLVEKEITSEMRRLNKSIEARRDRAVVLEKSLQTALNRQKKEVLSLSQNEKTIKYNVLNLEAKSNQDLYDLLLERLKRVNLTTGLEDTNIRLVDEAEIPYLPESQRKISLEILFSMVLGLALGSGLAFFLEYMDDSVKTPEDVLRRLGIPVIGVLPYDKSLTRSDTKAMSYLENYSDQEEHAKQHGEYIYLNNLINVETMRQDKQGHVVLIESAGSGEGKTTVLTKSAVDLSLKGYSVLAIDTDHYRPAVHKTFGLTDEKNGLITAMRDILHRKITEGNLSDYSMDDIFFLIALKKQSGKLFITNDSQNMMVVFRNGTPIHFQSENSPLANRLGAMLLCGGFITESQLQDALERNKRTGKALGYILLNAGYLSLEQLKGPLKLQMEENLQRIFSWKSGVFEFRPGGVEKYRDEKIYFDEDYAPMIRSLGLMSGSCILESAALSYVKPVIKPYLSVLPSGKISVTENLYGRLYFALLEKFLNILKRNYDVILMDAPPLLDVEGGTSLAALADGVVMVTKAGSLSVKAINEATASLRGAKANILGVILNQAKI